MVEQVDRNQVRKMVAAGAQLVDVMPAAEYEAAHIEGAINIPLRELNSGTTAGLDRGRPVIVYCNDFQ